MNGSAKNLHPEQINELMTLLNTRFHKYMQRHPNLKWQDIESRLLSRPDKLWSLNEMENTGGEPDVIDYNPSDDAYLFADCSAETPSGRRNLCYDRQALDSRKKYKPENSALDLAKFMNIKLMSEAQYFDLQNLGEFDTKTSSWLESPFAIRNLGGALFGDRRYGRVFIYHNGASSYYSVRGFRGTLEI